MLFVWTGFWSLDPRYLSSEPLQVLLMLFNVAFSILIATGVAKAWRARQPAMFPIAVFAVFHPVVYYLTHPAIEYRHAIDPAMVLLGVAGVDCLIARARRQAWTAGAGAAPEDEAALPLAWSTSPQAKNVLKLVSE